ncbi:MAG TPA: hypothetical protein EYP14_00880, partial [Planctomycetaceae bacterium]|nr:hypothetical protein [Planctomycetaceae bacterium]
PVLVPTSPGWDSRPWHGRKAFVQVDRTPEAFEEHLRLARRFVIQQKQPPVVLIEAWNEFGEGSYCEPHKEFGFGHLDAVRRVFCPEAGPHEDYAPVDVGLGPYDVSAPTPDTTEWCFDRDGDTEGWMGNGHWSDLTVSGGVLTGRTTGRDPVISRRVRLRARRFQTLELRMAVSGTRPGEKGQLFWATTFSATSEPASIRFRLRGDGRMHTYLLPLDENPFWRGIVTQLRLDPCSTENVQVQIDWIRVRAR